MKNNVISIHNRLFNKMLALFIIIVVIPSLLIGITSSKLFLNILVEKASESYDNSLNNLKSSLQNELFETKMSAYYMYLDLDLKEAIIEFDIDNQKSKNAEKRVQEKFYNYKISTNFSNVNAIRVYGFNGFDLSFGDSYYLDNLDDSRIISSDWYSKALENPDEFIWTGLQSRFNKSGDKKSISIFRVLKDRSYTKNIGLLYVNLNAQIFDTLSESFNYNIESEMYLLDNNNISVGKNLAINVNNILSSNSDFTDIKGDKYFLKTLPDFNWKIIGILPVERVTESTITVFSNIAIGFILFLVTVCILWFFALSRVFVPIKKLTNAISHVNDGDLDVEVKYSGKDEFGILINNFNFMVTRIKNLLNRVVEENSRKKDAEYKALQAQINPHFLYNTLNSIRWMAIIQKADNIKNVVDVLGRLLRHSTRKMDQYITVGEEINNLKDYVYIQQIAYSNRFEVKYNICESVLDIKCLKFILQPLVENSIFHGILPKQIYGTIWVDIKELNNYLIFKVKDDGVGIDNEIIDKFNPYSISRLNSLGLGGIFERLELCYNCSDIVTIESVKNKFTSITLKIPTQRCLC